MQKLVIKRTITLTTEVPFNKDYYPDCETIEQAVKYEEGLELIDKLENFVETLSNADFEELGTEGRLTDSNTKGKYQEQIATMIVPD